jgi:methionyl-tRNA formyltransferase
MHDQDTEYAICATHAIQGETMARVVFMGTPEFAVSSLLALCEHHDVVGVVTQPDRPAGRGRILTLSPVKQAALAAELPVFQPKTLRSPGALDHLAGWQPDVIVVAAFGQILPTPVLELPPHGCLNLHGSLLPRYRGAAPIPAAILAGDSVTGITLMHMDEGLDTGPILAQVECSITAMDTTASLAVKLSDLAAQLLVATLPRWIDGELQAQPQDDSMATYCGPLKKEDGHLDWTRSAVYLDRQVRACDPWPGAYTTWQGRTLKVLRARPRADKQAPGELGQVVALEPGVGVVTGDGLLQLVDVQLAGKRAVTAEQFARGQRRLIGRLLGG